MNIERIDKINSKQLASEIKILMSDKNLGNLNNQQQLNNQERLQIKNKKILHLIYRQK